METVFSTSEVHVRDRFDYWHDVACRSIVNHDSRPECRLTFNAAISSRRFGRHRGRRVREFTHGYFAHARPGRACDKRRNFRVPAAFRVAGARAERPKDRSEGWRLYADRSTAALRREVFLRVELACSESSAASTGSPSREDARDGSPRHHSVQRRDQSDVIVSRYAAISRRPDATSHRANHQGSGTRSGRRVADQRDGTRQDKIFISSLGCSDECARRDRDATVRFGSRHRHSGRRCPDQRAVRQCCAGTRGHLDHAPHSDQATGALPTGTRRPIAVASDIK